MRGVLALVFLVCALPPAAAAEIYRCLQTDGSVRFVGDASTCPGAQPHEPRGEIQQMREPGDTPPASYGEAAPAPSLTSLEELFPPAQTAGTSGVWEVVPEASIDASGDPDFVRWGLREKRVRHYTHRNDTGRVRVCTVELWSFESEERARTAEENFSYPNWRFQRAGSLLVMLHAVSRQRGEPASQRVFPECSRLGARIVTRAASGGARVPRGR
jgi:hypothetical protein